METDIHRLLEANLPYFANNRLEHFVLKDILLNTHLGETTPNGVVDLSRVVGTMHPDYSDATWLELLPSSPDNFTHLGYWERQKYEGRMKRGWNSIREMRANPMYYLNAEEKTHWSFYEMNGLYYISEGNHRTVVARFLLWLNGMPECIDGVSITKIKPYADPPNCLHAAAMVNCLPICVNTSRHAHLPDRWF
jgi:hypothetical protein